MKNDEVDKYKRLFRQSFNENGVWTDWYFRDVVRPEYLHVLTNMNEPSRLDSALLTLPYTFDLYGSDLPMSYICGVATDRSVRGKGRMTALMKDVLAMLRWQGKALCTLIPASRRLYFFYDSFGFRTVFYAEEEIYTSVHNFDSFDAEVEEFTPDYQTFTRLERAAGMSVLHTQEDFSNIIADNSLDGGHIVGVTDPADGSEAMAVGVIRADGSVLVNSLLSDNERMAQAALGALKDKCGERTVCVMRRPYTGIKSRLRANGMMRILDVRSVLAAVARAFPQTVCRIKVRDPLIESNNGCFEVADGNVSKLDDDTRRRVSLDVGIGVLALILFGSPNLSDIIGIPASRPTMELML